MTDKEFYRMVLSDLLAKELANTFSECLDSLKKDFPDIEGKKILFDLMNDPKECILDYSLIDYK